MPASLITHLRHVAILEDSNDGSDPRVKGCADAMFSLPQCRVDGMLGMYVTKCFDVQAHALFERVCNVIVDEKRGI
jgi:hypothetical protein